MHKSLVALTFWALLALMGILLLAGAEVACRSTSYCSPINAGALTGAQCRTKTVDRLSFPVNCESRHYKYDSGKRIFDFVNSREGEFRYVPQTGSPESELGILFFGCSFTEGVGVDDSDAMPAVVARNFPGVEVKNYASGGGGPQNALAILTNPRGPLSILTPRGEKTVGVYALMGNQVIRVDGRNGAACGWVGRLPRYYYDVNGQLYRQGIIADSCPLPRVMVDKLQESHLFQRLTRKLYYNPNVKDFRLAADLILASREAFRRRFRSERFFVVVYPSNDPDLYTRDIIGALKQAGITVFDYRHIVDYPDPASHLEGDNHPSALTQRKVGEALAADLKKAL